MPAVENLKEEKRRKAEEETRKRMGKRKEVRKRK
jgi:hypothetical protein